VFVGLSCKYVRKEVVVLELLQSAARAWSEQRIPETRGACLWQESLLVECERWLAEQPEGVALGGLERAFLDACRQQRPHARSSPSQRPGLLATCAFPAREDAHLACEDGGLAALQAGWPWGARTITAAQYQRWVELSYSFLLVALLCLAMCL